MRVSAGLGKTTLCVALDLRHPYAYLALGPTAELVASLRVDVDWLPMAAATLQPPTEPSSADDRGIRHRRHRAGAVAREVEVYGAAQGLVLRDLYRAGDAKPANLGWLWIRERSRACLPAYLEDMFRCYWSGALDPSDLDRAQALVETHSGDGSPFRAWAEAEGPEVLESVASEIREFGLYQSPAYVLEGEVFYGRQHLPMLRWIIEGRNGPGPI